MTRVDVGESYLSANLETVDTHGKLYRLRKDGREVLSPVPGQYAGWGPGKIFGRLDCNSGKRMAKKNRVFFASLEDAVREGFRPCRNCRPIGAMEFSEIAYLVPEETVEAFYARGRRGLSGREKGVLGQEVSDSGISL